MPSAPLDVQPKLLRFLENSEIHVPPLRERPEDIPVLARHFVRELTPSGEPPVLSSDAMAALLAHPWRGNVRELRNVIERALAFSPAPDVLHARHLRLGE